MVFRALGRRVQLQMHTADFSQLYNSLRQTRRRGGQISKQHPHWILGSVPKPA